MSDIVEKYLEYDRTDRIVFMTMDDALELSRALAAKTAAAAEQFDLIIGLANGALVPTKVLAEELSLPYEIIRLRRKSSRIKQRLQWLLRVLPLPIAFLRWKPVNAIAKAFNRHNNEVEQHKVALDVAGKSVLIVDDCMDSGKSVLVVRSDLIEQGATHVGIAVLAWGNKKHMMLEDQVPPDFFLHRLLHYYPWANNSPHYKRFKSWLSQNQMALWQ